MGPEWRYRKIPTFFSDPVRPPYKSTITTMPTYGNCHTPQWSPRSFLTSTEPGASYQPKRNADVSLCISTADPNIYTSGRGQLQDDTVAQWIRRWTAVPQIRGSNPPAPKIFYLNFSIAFYHRHLILCLPYICSRQ